MRRPIARRLSIRLTEFCGKIFPGYLGASAGSPPTLWMNAGLEVKGYTPAMGIGENLKFKVAREKWLNKRHRWLQNAWGAGIVGIVCLPALASSDGDAKGVAALIVLFSVAFYFYCLCRISTMLSSSKAVPSGDLSSSLLDVGRIWPQGRSNLEKLPRESGLEVGA